MSSISCKSFGLSSSLEEEVMVIKKQGIVSIVGYSDSDSETTKSRAAAAVSLRRTLSADMSSKTWLSQHGFSPLKRIASSQDFPLSSSSSSSSSEEEESPGQLQILNSIHHQHNNNHKPLQVETGQFDIWTSILSQKQECNHNNNNTPYIHPLVKRSASSLSGKSLQICTESLGSETGSDGFSSHPPSDAEDDQQELVEEEEQEQEVVVKRYEEDEHFAVEKYNNFASAKKSTTRSFPPPLPSLSRAGDGASLHMRPRRDNGRLVLEAVSVPSQNNFRAERQDGRLVLTFINNNEEEIIKSTTTTEEKNDVGLFREEECETEAEVVRLTAPKPGGGVMNVHRLALMMNKSVVLSNRTPTWSNKLEEEVNPITCLTQSLPPRPPVGRMISMTPAAAAAAVAAARGGGGGGGAGAGSLNAYEYYWKAKPMAPTGTSPIAQNQTISKNIIIGNEKQELLVLRGNRGDNYLLPLSSKGCKQSRRSLLFWEPYCIATS